MLLFNRKQRNQQTTHSISAIYGLCFCCQNGVRHISATWTLNASTHKIIFPSVGDAHLSIFIVFVINIFQLLIFHNSFNSYRATLRLRTTTKKTDTSHKSRCKRRIQYIFWIINKKWHIQSIHNNIIHCFVNVRLSCLNVDTDFVSVCHWYLSAPACRYRKCIRFFAVALRYACNSQFHIELICMNVNRDLRQSSKSSIIEHEQMRVSLSIVHTQVFAGKHLNNIINIIQFDGGNRKHKISYVHER